MIYIDKIKLMFVVQVKGDGAMSEKEIKAKDKNIKSKKVSGKRKVNNIPKIII